MIIVTEHGLMSVNAQIKALRRFFVLLERLKKMCYIGIIKLDIYVCEIDKLKRGEHVETIGKKLKEQRVSLGMTLDDVVLKTKMNRALIEALEQGDLSFFEKDLSYLAYYIRHYAKGIDLDYEELREEVEALTHDWTQTVQINEIHQRIILNDDIKDSKVKNDDEPKQQKKMKVKPKKKIDYSFLAFITTTVLIIILLLYVGIRYLPTWMGTDPAEQPDIDIPTQEPDTDKPGEGDGTNTGDPDGEGETVKPVTPSEKIEIVMIDKYHYEIQNWNPNEAAKFEVKFVANQTWVAVNVDKKQVKDPVSKTYVAGESIVLNETAEKDKEIMFHLGKMMGNEFYFNGERIELDENVQKSSGVAKIYFKFVEKGEE